MSEPTAAILNRELRRNTGRVRSVKRFAAQPDYNGTLLGDASDGVRTKAFLSASPNAVPTNGAATVRTAPDLADMNRWHSEMRCYMSFTGGLGQTCDIQLYALNLATVDANSVYVLIGTLTGVGHLEEIGTDEARGRPLLFRIYNGTANGTLNCTPLV